MWIKLRVSRARAPKWTKSCRSQGESVCPSVCTSLCPFIPQSNLKALSPLESILTQILPNSPNPRNIAQIWAKWSGSKHNGPNPSKMAQIWSECRYGRTQYWSKGPKSCTWGQIWAILLGFGPLYLDLGHIAFTNCCTASVVFGVHLYCFRQSVY